MAEQPRINVCYDGHRHWKSGTNTQETYTTETLKDKLNERHPFHTFEKILAEVEEKGGVLRLESDAVEYIEDGNRKELKELIDDNFEMLVCLDPERCLMLHKHKSMKIKGTSMENMIRLDLIPNFERKNDTKYYLIYKDKSGELRYESKNYLERKKKIEFEFNDGKSLKDKIDENLRQYEYIKLSDISPFFIKEPIEILINFVINELKIGQKNSDCSPSLEITFNSIKYKGAQNEIKELKQFVLDYDKEIKKDLEEFFKPSSSNDKPPMNDEKEIPLPISKAEESDETTQPSIQQKDIGNDEAVKELPLLPRYKKYYTHLKPSKGENNGQFELVFKKENDDESWLEEKFVNLKTFDEIIRELESCFKPKNTGFLLNEIARYQIYKQHNINFEKKESKSESYRTVMVTGNINKEELEKEKNSLASLEAKLKKRGEEISEKERKHKELQALVENIRRKLNLDESDNLLDKVRELKNDLGKVQNELKQITDFTKPLGENQETIKEKIDHLKNQFGDPDSPNKDLAEISAEEFGTFLKTMKESYDKMESINKLRAYDGKDLTLFTKLFGDLRGSVNDAVDKLDKGLQTVDITFIIRDAIRGRLSNPELRKTKISDPNALNGELKNYGLQIYIPSTSQTAEPSRHKVVGYETGGARGIVSSVVSWGVIEILKDGSEGPIIFKSEVKIYQ